MSGLYFGEVGTFCPFIKESCAGRACMFCNPATRDCQMNIAHMVGDDDVMNEAYAFLGNDLESLHRDNEAILEGLRAIYKALKGE